MTEPIRYLNIKHFDLHCLHSFFALLSLVSNPGGCFYVTRRWEATASQDTRWDFDIDAVAGLTNTATLTTISAHNVEGSGGSSPGSALSSAPSELLTPTIGSNPGEDGWEIFVVDGGGIVLSSNSSGKFRKRRDGLVVGWRALLPINQFSVLMA